MIYKKVNQEYGFVIQKIVDNKEWSIPAVNDNTDYQAYLAWVAEGNEAEEVEQ